eukprot:ctg_2408.g577
MKSGTEYWECGYRVSRTIRLFWRRDVRCGARQPDSQGRFDDPSNGFHPNAIFGAHRFSHFAAAASLDDSIRCSPCPAFVTAAAAVDKRGGGGIRSAALYECVDGDGVGEQGHDVQLRFHGDECTAAGADAGDAAGAHPAPISRRPLVGADHRGERAAGVASDCILRAQRRRVAVGAALPESDRVLGHQTADAAVHPAAGLGSAPRASAGKPGDVVRSNRWWNAAHGGFRWPQSAARVCAGRRQLCLSGSLHGVREAPRQCHSAGHVLRLHSATAQRHRHSAATAGGATER